MRVLIPTLLPLMLCAAARGQEASVILFDFSAGSTTPLNSNPTWSSDDLNADDFTHFAFRVTGLSSNHFVIVFAHMYPEAEGSEEGYAAVETVTEIHPWMQHTSASNTAISFPTDTYELDANSASLQVPVDRVNSYLSTALNSSTPEAYGMSAPSGGTMVLEPNASFGNDPADERAFYSLPNVWLSYQEPQYGITYGAADLRTMA
ncbi:MAG: hypothetical protein KDC95_17765, partial [Planctomycetes bacterium]|nr:hypothetical protein [Planctomycetota bacterium]